MRTFMTKISSSEENVCFVWILLCVYGKTADFYVQKLECAEFSSARFLWVITVARVFALFQPVSPSHWSDHTHYNG